jgi:hypothetical protein
MLCELLVRLKLFGNKSSAAEYKRFYAENPNLIHETTLHIT